MMKKISIKAPSFRDKIGAELQQIQRGCSVRTITDDDIIAACGELDQMLAIPKKALKGVCAHIDIHARAFPSAYKYDPYSTHVYLQHNGKCWCVFHLSREHCTRRHIFLVHTPESKEALISRFTEVMR